MVNPRELISLDSEEEAMSILWEYLDKQRATERFLKDYGTMKFIIDHAPERIREEEEKMVGVRSPGFDGMPHSHNPQACEERIINGITAIDEEKERVKKAMEYMAVYKPVWEKLSDDERYILDAFYAEDGSYGNYTADLIADKFHVSRASAYRMKDSALRKVIMLLYGSPS